MIVGIGTDLVDVTRFTRALERAPRITSRLFDDVELSSTQRSFSPPSLAARFAAKEAVIKALGGAPGARWCDIVIPQKDNGAPTVKLRGAAAAKAQSLGISAWHVSLTHDGDLALAFVVAERL